MPLIAFVNNAMHGTAPPATHFAVWINLLHHRIQSAILHQTNALINFMLIWN